MEQTFAVLDANNVVVNIIVADQAFVDMAYPGSPALTAPGGVGSAYDPVKQTFGPVPQAGE